MIPSRKTAQPSETDRDRGQILLIFAFGLIVFIGFAALTVDVGSLYSAKRSYQNATDAAALAGAAYLTRGTDSPCQGAGTKPVCARTASWNYLNDQLGLGLDSTQIGVYATSNTGATPTAVVPSAGGSAYKIWVSTPPNGAGSAASTSTVADQPSVMFVRVDRQRDVFFGKIFAPGGFPVSAWATAGSATGRFAVITLRQGSGASGQSGPANTNDIRLAGNNTTLNIVNGDIGGNWGMKLNSGNILKFTSNPPGDAYNARLVDNVSCGSSCWSPGQVQDGAGNTLNPAKLPPYVPDPMYPAPPGLTSSAPNGPMLTGPLTIPKAVGTDANGDLTVANNTTSGLTADGSSCQAGVKRSVIGPGWYRNIDIAGGQCVILSGTRQRTVFNDATTESDVPTTQQPGVYYITGQVKIGGGGSGGLVVGDGVTVVIRPSGSNNQFTPNGVMDLNRGFAAGTPLKLGAWTTKGVRTYAIVGGKWQYQSGLEADLTTNGVGVALYVLRPDQYSASPAPDANTVVIVMTSNGAGLGWNGVTYAPRDNVTISGQPSHDGVGQLVSWTFTFNGGTNVTQTYEGPGDGFPYLIEPCVLSGGACQ